jgi:preprotein translocase subunit YajC
MTNDFLSFATPMTLAQDGTAASAAPARPVGMPGAAPAAATVQPGGTAAPAAGQPQGAGSSMLPMIVLLAFGVMFISMLLSGRKDQKKRKELIESMRKGDKVQTGGGIIGTVAEIGQDDVVLKVEEGRIRFAKAAIVSVLRSSGAKAEAQIAEPKSESKPVSV